MVEKSFFDQRLITFFMKEQMALYAWRRSFFLSQFPDGGWTTDCNFFCMAEGVCGEVHTQAAILCVRRSSRFIRHPYAGNSA